jgi:hypothetical protein
MVKLIALVESTAQPLCVTGSRLVADKCGNSDRWNASVGSPTVVRSLYIAFSINYNKAEL